MIFETHEEGGFYAAAARKKRRAISLGASIVIHGSLAAFLMSGIHWAPVEVYTPAIPRDYSVRWLRLDASDLRPYIPAKPSVVKPEVHGITLRKPALASPAPDPAPETTETASVKIMPPAKVARIFEPPVLKRKPANQTLIQLDAPPDLVPLPNVPLPTAVLWSRQNQKVQIAKVAAPPAPKLPRIVHETPSRPTIDPPNAELVAANVQMSSAFINNQPSLPLLPAVTAPVRAPDEHGDELPQTPVPPAIDRKVPNVVSLPTTPMLAKEAIMIPPANQVAPPTPSRPAGGQPAGQPADQATGTAQGGQRVEPNGPVPKSSTAGATSAGEGALNKDQILANSKRILLPKDGKFGAVVMGSSSTGPYTEAQGALSGKILYTVYLRVGLKKNWILQYGLPKSAEAAAAPRGGTANLEAPWPYLLVTPHYSALLDQQYIILRGTLNTAGRLEQLKLITPSDYGGRELLESTLQIWQFRPAKKDGEDTAVEVLLIIPRQES